VLTTHTPTTRLHQAILPRHGCLGIRRGSRTLTGGRLKPAHQTTYTTPHRILLSNLHSYRTELRHLREGTPRGHEGPRTLETAPCRNRNPRPSTHGPCQPHLLESPQKGKSEGSTLVLGAARIQPTNQTRTRETTPRGGPPISPPASRPWGDRQRERHAHRQRTLHQTPDGTGGRVDGPRAKDRPGTRTGTRRSRPMESKP
jgi:hypothetical protein